MLMAWEPCLKPYSFFLPSLLALIDQLVDQCQQAGRSCAASGRVPRPSTCTHDLIRSSCSAILLLDCRDRYTGCFYFYTTLFLFLSPFDVFHTHAHCEQAGIGASACTVTGQHQCSASASLLIWGPLEFSAVLASL